MRWITMKRWMQGPVSASGLVLLTFFTAASRNSDGPIAAPAKDSPAGNPTTPAPPTSSPTPSLEEELKSFEEQLGVPSAAESLFAGGRKPDLVVVTSTDVHGEIEPCG
jgi:hypothetical protein